MREHAQTLCGEETSEARLESMSLCSEETRVRNYLGELLQL